MRARKATGLVVRAVAASIALASPCLADLPGLAPTGWARGRAWRLPGPLGNSRGCAPGDAAASNWIAPLDLATIRPSEGESVPIDFERAACGLWLGAGDSPAWISLEDLGLAASDLVDLGAAAAALGAREKRTIPSVEVVAVLATSVVNRGDLPRPVRICTASDDSLQVWVNDRRVQEVHACRGAAADCSEETPAVLVPGANLIKVLVWQGDGAWGCRLRLETAEGAPITSADPVIVFGPPRGEAPDLGPLSVERTFDVSPVVCPPSGGSLGVTL